MSKQFNERFTMGRNDAVSRLERALAGYLEARAFSLTEARTRLGLNELDAKALLYVRDHPGTRPSSLRAYLGVTSAGVTTLIDRLIDRGAISREGDPSDRRATLLKIAADLDAPPWNVLTRFDSDFAGALHAAGIDECTRCADALEAATVSARAIDDTSRPGKR